MIGIKYGEFNETADLNGLSIADVRQQYTEEFGLSDKARAKLNGERIGRKQEEERILVDEDELCFEEKRNKSLVLLGAFLLALAVTGGIFAYTTTTASIQLSVTTGPDFADITANNTADPAWAALGRLRGVIPEGSLFDIAVDSNYTGDLVVNVYLSNPDELSNDYSSWMMRVNLANSSNVSIDTFGSTEILSLDVPMASFQIQSSNITGSAGTIYIHVLGGSFKSFGSGWITPEQPIMYAQVVQAGAH